MDNYTTVLNHGFVKLSTGLLKTIDYRYRGTKYVNKAIYNPSARTIRMQLTSDQVKAQCFKKRQFVGTAKAKVSQGFNGQVICIRNIFGNMGLKYPNMDGYRFSTSYDAKNKTLVINLNKRTKTKLAKNTPKGN